MYNNKNSLNKRSFISALVTGILGFFLAFNMSRTTTQLEMPTIPDTTLIEEHEKIPEIQSAVGTYYDGISSSLTGNDLLSALRSLNSSKRIRTIGYKNFGNYYLQTDGDPNNSKNIISFYSGNSVEFTGSFSGNVNREHVWPKSRGGSLVDADIHMPRPTIASENGSRGNSFYVEGMKSTTVGWDPAMESFGLEKYRGISARIIFYSVVASSSLSLIDATNDNTANKTMGKLSDLLSWNLRYGIDDTEIRRNEAIAGSDIQGNRNPFIDHPEYACKIWGDTNSTTQSICAAYSNPTISLDKTTASVNVGSTTTLTATVTNSSSGITWTSSKTSVATVNSSGVVTGVSTGTATITASITENSVQYTATCTITVNPAGFVGVSGISLNNTNASILIGNTVGLTATIAPSNATNKTVNWTSSSSSIATVSSSTGTSITVNGVGKGTATITATSADGGFTATCLVVVSDPNGSSEWVKITSAAGLIPGKYIITAPRTPGGELMAMKNDNGTSGAPPAVSLSWYGSGASAVPLESSYNDTAGTDVIWDITKNGNSYTIRPTGVSDNNLYSTNANNGLRVGTTPDTWSLNYVNSYITMQEANNKRWVEIYNASDFRGYESITSGGQLSANADCFKMQFFRYDTVVSSTLTSISVTNNPSKTSYVVGETLNLSGLVITANYSDNSSSVVTGYTTNPANGATLNTVGTQVVTVSYVENSITKTTTFNVTVSSGNVALAGVTLNVSSGNLVVGGTLNLTATINPNNAYPGPTISWSTSNVNVASVSNGVVTAIGVGTATITVTAKQGTTTKTATCTVNVAAAPFSPTTTYESGGIGTTATLVTDVSTLSAGDIIVISTSTGHALGAANGTFRSSTSVTISGNKITSLGSATLLTLGGSSGAWTLSNDTEYLYYTGSKNTLQTGTSSSSGNTWNITITSNIATITNVASPTRVMQYNNSSPRYACYTSSQVKPSIYKVDASTPLYNYDYLIDVLDGDYCTMDLAGLNLIYTRYNAMTSTEITHFNSTIITGQDSNEYTGLEAYTEAMLRRTKLQGSAISNISMDLFTNNQFLYLTIGISTLSIIAIFSYFLMRKKYS